MCVLCKCETLFVCGSDGILLLADGILAALPVVFVGLLVISAACYGRHNNTMLDWFLTVVFVAASLTDQLVAEER